MTDAELEQQLLDKGLSAPRVTLEHIESLIAEEHYFSAYDGIRAANQGVDAAWWANTAADRHTFCYLLLTNGYTVTGENACVSKENFDPELSRQLARRNAIAKIWPLEGYLLKQTLSDEQNGKSENIWQRTVRLLQKRKGAGRTTAEPGQADV